MSPAKPLHPLLLEPSYWRGRARALEAHRGGVIWTPRPDLEVPGIRVLEFRLRSLDGVHLRGLFSRSTWRSGNTRAVLRTVGPASRLEVREDEVRGGTAEFVLQEPAGRPLADRVLDVVLLSQVAAEMDGIGQVEVDRWGRQVRLEDRGHPGDRGQEGPEGRTKTGDQRGCEVHQWESDAAAIAQQLLIHRIVSPSADDPNL